MIANEIIDWATRQFLPPRQIYSEVAAGGTAACLVLDCSMSMGAEIRPGITRLLAAKQACLAFAQRAAESRKYAGIAVVSFSSHADIRCGLTPPGERR